MLLAKRSRAGASTDSDAMMTLASTNCNSIVNAI